ncbi:hypothetical protein JIY74_30660 [Vibrio harveyi]|nr:hypothetical protein [Vibrio harveyi]
MLKFLTFLTEQEINDLIESHKKEPHKRVMQKALATEITKFVHGQEGLEKAIKLTDAFFKGDLYSLTDDLLKMAIVSLPSIELEKSTKIIDVLVSVSASSSKREAREFINSKAIYVNGKLVIDENQLLSDFKTIEEKYLLIKRGKRKYFSVILK